MQSVKFTHNFFLDTQLYLLHTMTSSKQKCSLRFDILFPNRTWFTFSLDKFFSINQHSSNVEQGDKWRLLIFCQVSVYPGLLQFLFGPPVLSIGEVEVK